MGLPAISLPRQTGTPLAERIRVDDVAQIDAGQLLVRHFDADGSFAGNRRFDADIRRSQFQGQVVGEMDDFADLDASRRFQFIARNGRPLAGIEYLGVDIEALQRFLEDAGIFPDFIAQADGVLRTRFQHAHRRQMVRLFTGGFGNGTAPFFARIDGDAALFDFDGFEVVHVMTKDIRFLRQRRFYWGGRLDIVGRRFRIADDGFMDLAERLRFR